MVPKSFEEKYIRLYSRRTAGSSDGGGLGVVKLVLRSAFFAWAKQEDADSCLVEPPTPARSSLSLGRGASSSSSSSSSSAAAALRGSSAANGSGGCSRLSPAQEEQMEVESGEGEQAEGACQTAAAEAIKRNRTPAKVSCPAAAAAARAEEESSSGGKGAAKKRLKLK
jgi:hypothetical protein